MVLLFLVLFGCVCYDINHNERTKLLLFFDIRKRARDFLQKKHFFEAENLEITHSTIGETSVFVVRKTEGESVGVLVAASMQQKGKTYIINEERVYQIVMAHPLFRAEVINMGLFDDLSHYVVLLASFLNN